MHNRHSDRWAMISGIPSARSMLTILSLPKSMLFESTRKSIDLSLPLERIGKLNLNHIANISVCQRFGLIVSVPVSPTNHSKPLLAPLWASRWSLRYPFNRIPLCRCHHHSNKRNALHIRVLIRITWISVLEIRYSTVQYLHVYSWMWERKQGKELL